MVKKLALLVGLNYPGDTKYMLNGSYNDVLLVQNHLIDNEGFKNEHILILSDKNPKDSQLSGTFFNIVKRIKEIIELATSDDVCFFYFSGHGRQIVDTNNDEIDFKDECFIPSDHTKNIITDDLIYDLFSNANCSVISMFDCCSSGSIADLKYKFSLNPYSLITNLSINDESKDIVCLSSCSESKDSYEQVLPTAVGQVKWFSIYTYNIIKHLSSNSESFETLMDYCHKDNILKHSSISFSNLKLKKSIMFEPFDTDDIQQDIQNINDNIVLRGKMNDIIKKNKKFKKDIIKLNNTISKYQVALRIRSGSNVNPFNKLLYNLSN
jgi:hypothetical protein